MTPPTPISTVGLFPDLNRHLQEILTSLSPDDWQRPTLASLWTVKDVAAHILDGNIRGLSMSRDSFFGVSPGEIRSYPDLVQYLNQLNADWVTAARRISPALLISLLASTGDAYARHLTTLDPFEPAIFSVGWAGETQSANWFHIAREYMERWHHQQQIRFAVGQEQPLLAPDFYAPFLDTAMRALPHHYRDTPANDHDTIRFSVTDNLGTWFLIRQADQWILSTQAEHPAVCSVVLDRTIAWRLFTKGITAEQARSRVQITGNPSLGEPIFGLLAVMA
ncbi:MAG: maleylpyruvate isomerase N-terminal domain-containing protein [Bacteroidetes bacterium]|nr:maleylpyruvate isomerase N-terminal domain-containing protein [Fibrella sp.]